MADPAKKKASYADVLAAPEHMIAEVIDGTLHLQPRPSARHAVVASVIGEELGPPFKRGKGGPGGWIILDEPELHLSENVVVPDLAGWRRERLPVVGDEAFFTLAPDWACEVLSPSTEKRDRAEKLPLYGNHRVGHVWLVNPLQRTLEVMKLTDEGWLTKDVFRDDDSIRAEPFDAIELDLSVLWADLAEPRLPER